MATKEKRTKAKKQVQTTTSAPISAPLVSNNNALFDFETPNGDDFWFSLSKNEFGPLQPLHELIDNAAAAIIACFNPTSRNSIFTNLDFEKGIGKIEHVGGQTFPTNAKDLSRCFTYGGRNPTLLNEHGCGLKTSLAILDPKNRDWNIYIRSLGKLFKINAPYSNKMTLHNCSVWPGQDTSDECASLIEFPISKDRFKSLYTKKDVKMIDLDTRVRCELSHMWMLQDNVRNGSIKLYYNNELIVPFSFRHDKIHECVANIPLAKTTYKFAKSDAELELEQIKLKDSARKIPDSYWFQYAQIANGIYIFKNGRFIEKITDGPLYERVIGNKPHHYHNGTIIIANVKGTQDSLPVTSTTKNRFLQTNPLFEEMLDIISNNIVKPDTREHHSEETTIQKFKQEREALYKSIGVNATITAEKIYDISDSGKSPPIDLIVELADRIFLYEGKDFAALQVSIISQIYTNYLCVKKANPNKTIVCYIILKAVEEADARITEQHKSVVDLYKAEDPSFALKVQNYKNEILYSF